MDNDGKFDDFRTVERFVDHPGWSNDGRTRRPVSEYVADIALVFLESPLPAAVVPFRMRTLNFAPIGMPVIVGGYGRQGVAGSVVRNGSDGTYDRQFATNVINGIAYNTLLRTDLTNKPFPGLSTSKGAGFPEGQIAPGDSGGGVFSYYSFSKSYTNFQTDILYYEKPKPDWVELIAINSNGSSDSLGDEAGYVFIAPYYNWIVTTIENNGHSRDDLQPGGGVGLQRLDIPAVPFSQEMMTAEPADSAGIDLRIDKFPNVDFAAIDEDDDGYPDEWGAAGIAPDTVEYNGYYLDQFPGDSRYGRDDDADGLPDDWEREYFGGLGVADASTDFDNDGTRDLDEYANDSDPVVTDEQFSNIDIDAYEPDNTAADAKSVSIGGLQYRTLHLIEESDHARFSLSGSAKSSVTITTDGFEGDTVLHLLDDSFQLLAVDDDSGENLFSRIQIDLEPGDYFVEVVGYSGETVPEYTLLVEVQSAPVPLSPEQREAKDASQPIELKFSPVDSALKYQVQRYDRLQRQWTYSNAIVSPDACTENSSCSVITPALDAQKNAIWRVRAFSDAGWSQWSELVYFDVTDSVIIPDAPNPISPLIGSPVVSEQPVTITFGSVAGADRYQVQHYDRTQRQWTYSSASITPSACGTTNCSVSTPGLPEQQRAIWRVRAHNSAGWGGWSELVYFDVQDAVILPATPEPLFPLEGAVLAAGEPVVVAFTPIDSATQYQVQRYDRELRQWTYSNANIAVDACSDTRCEVAVPGLPAQSDAIWRVRAYNNSGWGQWSRLV